MPFHVLTRTCRFKTLAAGGKRTNTGNYSCQDLEGFFSVWFNGVVVIIPVLHFMYTGGRRFDPGLNQLLFMFYMSLQRISFPEKNCFGGEIRAFSVMSLADESAFTTTRMACLEISAPES